MSITVLQPPPFTEDDRKRISPSVLPRLAAERRIVWNLLHHLADAGYLPVHVDNGDEEPTPTIEKMFEEAFAVDDCFIVVQREDVKHWVRLIVGNGVDIISDYAWSKRNEHWNEMMEKFNPELYV